jgi:hypothetical protein
VNYYQQTKLRAKNQENLVFGRNQRRAGTMPQMRYGGEYAAFGETTSFPSRDDPIAARLLSSIK